LRSRISRESIGGRKKNGSFLSREGKKKNPETSPASRHKRPKPHPAWGWWCWDKGRYHGRLNRLWSTGVREVRKDRCPALWEKNLQPDVTVK